MAVFVSPTRNNSWDALMANAIARARETNSRVYVYGYYVYGYKGGGRYYYGVQPLNSWVLWPRHPRDFVHKNGNR